MRVTLRLSGDARAADGMLKAVTLGAQPFVIGRDASCDWSVSDGAAMMSRRHCTLRLKDGRVLLTDESSNGTALGDPGNRLVRGQPTPLPDTARLWLAGEHVRVDYEAHAAEAPQETEDFWGLDEVRKRNATRRDGPAKAEPLPDLDLLGVDEPDRNDPLNLALDEVPRSDALADTLSLDDEPSPRAPMPAPERAEDRTTFTTRAAGPSAASAADLFAVEEADEDDPFSDMGGGGSAAAPDPLSLDDAPPPPPRASAADPLSLDDDGPARDPLALDDPPPRRAADPLSLDDDDGGASGPSTVFPGAAAPARDPLSLLDEDEAPRAPDPLSLDDSPVGGSGGDPLSLDDSPALSTAIPGAGLAAAPPTVAPARPQTLAPPPDVASGPPQRAPARPAAAEDDAAVTVLLATLGIPAHEIPPEARPALVAEIGRSYRALADGLRQLLAARRDVKIGLGLGATQIETGANPLKFVRDADGAVNALLRPSASGYLAGTVAVEDAVQALVRHQGALVGGVRASMQVALDAFEPKSLEEKIAKRGLAAVIPMKRKAELWERFTQHYNEFAAEANDDIRRVIGKALEKLYAEEATASREALDLDD